MKSKKISLKLELFLVIISLALLIILMFVIFQIGLLENFYRSRKIRKTSSLIAEVKEIINNQDFNCELGIINENIVSQIEQISVSEETAVYIISEPLTKDDEKVNWVYRTHQGEYYKRINVKMVYDIWNISKERGFTSFYTVPESNENILGIYDINMPVNKIRKHLSSQTESIICCSFINSFDGKTYLLVLDNKIVPVVAAVDTMKSQIAYITIIAIVIASILAFLLSKFISKPISKLNDEAKKLSEGNYNVKFNGKGYLEINELNNTLNNMTVELQKTENLRRELMANVSHDLRTPLTMIKGYAEMIQDFPEEDNSKNLKIICDEVDRLNLLVNDMLDLSKLTSNSFKLNIEKVNITSLLNEIVNRINELNNKNNLKIKLNFEKEYFVHCDKTKIEQVVYNFIYNAIKYSKADILVEQKELDGKLRISVYDYGVGIKEEELKVIWDRYYRVDKSHQRSIDGSGLGLSIVKAILEHHNFNYGVNSEINEGSTFWFEIPLK